MKPVSIQYSEKEIFKEISKYFKDYSKCDLNVYYHFLKNGIEDKCPSESHKKWKQKEKWLKEIIRKLKENNLNYYVTDYRGYCYINSNNFEIHWDSEETIDEFIEKVKKAKQIKRFKI